MLFWTGLIIFSSELKLELKIILAGSCFIKLFVVLLFEITGSSIPDNAFWFIKWLIETCLASLSWITKTESMVEGFISAELV